MNIREMKVYNVLFRMSVIAVVLFKSEAPTITIIQSRTSTAKLSCPTTDSTIVWYGPPNLMMYANGQGVNTNLAKRHRLSVTLDRKLLIDNTTQDDEGFYRCVYVEDGFVKDTNFQLVMARKPTILSIKHRIQTEKRSITNITVNIDAIPAPTVSWLLSQGGKVGAWQVTDTGNGTFLLSSTVFLLHDEHFGLYTALIRNSEGNVEVQFNLHGYEPVIIVDAASKSYNTSNSITITCFINDTLQRSWNSTWYHSRNGFPIRTISGSYNTNSATLRIPYCDYQDHGIYTCTWTNDSSSFSSFISLTVNSVPVITTRNVMNTNNSFIFSIRFYSNTSPLRVIWYLDDELVQNITMTSLKRTNVKIPCYGKVVQDNGFEAIYKTSTFNNETVVFCLIQNQYGYTESQIPFDFLTYNVPILTTDDLVGSTFNQGGTYEHADTQDHMEMYRFIAVGGGVLLVILFSVSLTLVLWIKKQKRQKININNTRRQMERTNSNESAYDEIENILEDFHRVQQESFNSNPVYLEVVEDTNESTNSLNVAEYLKPGIYQSCTELNPYKSLTGNAKTLEVGEKRDIPISTTYLRKTI